MFKNISRSSILFFGGALLFFLVIQILISTGQLNVFWVTLLRVGAVMAIVSLGLNLIYGFNGQFSLGQWGFYALGAYAAADITYWWHNQKSATALVVVLLDHLRWDRDSSSQESVCSRAWVGCNVCFCTLPYCCCYARLRSSPP